MASFRSLLLLQLMQTIMIRCLWALLALVCVVPVPSQQMSSEVRAGLARARAALGPDRDDARVLARGLDDLPPLSTGRVLRKDIEAAFRFRDDPLGVLIFD